MMKSLLIGTFVLSLTTPALAGQHEGHQPAPARPMQQPKPEPPPERVLGWEPIRCWRQVSAGAVTIGENFTVVLTCAVYEGDNAQVVPDESRLNVASIQLAPFEILGGAHAPDLRRGTRRFFQYSYHVRIISPDAVGHDTNLPPLTISYRIHSRVGAAATLEGRDLSYLLPMMPIKVLSLVPADAVDIRDGSQASLDAVGSLRFRSSVFDVLTVTFGALALVMVVLALVPLARSTAAAATAEPNRVPDRAVLDQVTRDLADIQAQASRDGWSDDLVSKAAGLVRIVSAAAIGESISQRPLPAGAATPEGRWLVRHGVVRKVSATVSSAVTADDIGRVRASQGAAFSTTRQQQHEGLQAGLAALTAALYREDPAPDAAAFDEAVRHAISVGREIAAEHSWVKETWARR